MFCTFRKFFQYHLYQFINKPCVKPSKNSLISDNHSVKPPVTSNHTLFQYVRIFSINVKIRANSIRSANFKSGLRSDHIFFQLGSDPISKNFEARNFRSDQQNLLGCPSLLSTLFRELPLEGATGASTRKSGKFRFERKLNRTILHSDFVTIAN